MTWRSLPPQPPAGPEPAATGPDQDPGDEQAPPRRGFVVYKMRFRTSRVVYCYYPRFLLRQWFRSPGPDQDPGDEDDDMQYFPAYGYFRWPRVDYRDSEPGAE